MDESLFDFLVKDFRGVPAAALARALNGFTPGVIWTGCNKATMLEALADNEHKVRGRILDSYGSTTALAKHIRNEEAIRRAERQVERKRKEKDEKAWIAIQKHMIDTATRMLDGKRVSKVDKEQMLRHAIPLMRARGYWA